MKSHLIEDEHGHAIAVPSKTAADFGLTCW